MQTERDFLRHALAALAYRAARALESTGEPFAGYAGVGRTPSEILAHMSDLMDWSLRIVQGSSRWTQAKPLAWKDELARFFAALDALDHYLAGDGPLLASAERLFQGPIADALTHVGQLTMMRRLIGEPMPGENYFVASMVVGRLGLEQGEPVESFR